MTIRRGISVRTNDVYFNLGDIQFAVSSRYMKDAKGFRVVVKKGYGETKNLFVVHIDDKIVEVNPKLKEILEDLVN